MTGENKTTPRLVMTVLGLGLTVSVGLIWWYINEYHEMDRAYADILLAVAMFVGFICICVGMVLYVYGPRSKFINSRWMPLSENTFLVLFGVFLGALGVIALWGYVFLQDDNRPTELVAQDQKEVEDKDKIITALRGEVATQKKEAAAQRKLNQSLTAGLAAAARAVGKNPIQFINEETEPLLGPIKLRSIPGIDTAEKYRDAIEHLRSEQNLRPLSEDEIGRPISQSPEGTYYFAISASLTTSKTESFRKRIARLRNYKSQPSGNVAELHTSSSGETYLIAFLSETDAARIGNLDGQNEYKILSYPYWSESKTVLVPIPAHRIVGSVGQDTTQYALDLRVR